MGPMSFGELSVLALFSLLVVLWFTRDPGFVAGWATYIFNRDAEYARFYGLGLAHCHVWHDDHLQSHLICDIFHLHLDMWQTLQLQSSLLCCFLFCHQNHPGFSSGPQMALKQVRIWHVTFASKQKSWSLLIIFRGTFCHLQSPGLPLSPVQLCSPGKLLRRNYLGT